MSDFSDRPFVAGSLVGIRSFKPVGDVLTAPVQRTMVWGGGENVAQCVPAGGFVAFGGGGGGSYVTNTAPITLYGGGGGRSGGSSVVNVVVGGTATGEPGHRPGSLGCRCGFYAYFNLGYNPHHSPRNVLGLIEGYGVVTVGNRGFRCEKARIVALIAPDIPDPHFARVFANYPDVPVFNSVEAAVAEFPLTVPEGTPEAPPPEDQLTAVFNVMVNSTAFVQSMKTVMESVNAAAATQSTAMAKLADALCGFRKVHDQTRPETPDELRERALQLRRTRNTGPVDPYRLTRRRAR